MKKTILVCSLLCVCMSDVMTMCKNSVTFPLVSQLRTPSETSLQHLARVAEQMDSASQTSQSSTVTTQVPNVTSSIELTMDKRMQEAYHYLFYARNYATALFVRGKSWCRGILDLIGDATMQIREAFSVFLVQTGNVKEKTANLQPLRSSTGTRQINVASSSELAAQLLRYPSANIEDLLSQTMQTALFSLIHAEYNATGLFVRGNANFKKVADLVGGASKQVREAFACFLSNAGRRVEPRIQPPREDQKQIDSVKKSGKDHLGKRKRKKK